MSKPKLRFVKFEGDEAVLLDSSKAGELAQAEMVFFDLNILMSHTSNGKERIVVELDASKREIGRVITHLVYDILVKASAYSPENKKLPDAMDRLTDVANAYKEISRFCKKYDLANGELFLDISKEIKELTMKRKESNAAFIPFSTRLSELFQSRLHAKGINCSSTVLSI